MSAEFAKNFSVVGLLSHNHGHMGVGRVLLAALATGIPQPATGDALCRKVSHTAKKKKKKKKVGGVESGHVKSKENTKVCVCFCWLSQIAIFCPTHR